jgi:hypothetical protein
MDSLAAKIEELHNNFQQSTLEDTIRQLEEIIAIAKDQQEHQSRGHLGTHRTPQPDPAQHLNLLLSRTANTSTFPHDNLLLLETQTGTRTLGQHPAQALPMSLLGQSFDTLFTVCSNPAKEILKYQRAFLPRNNITKFNTSLICFRIMEAISDNGPVEKYFNQNVQCRRTILRHAARFHTFIRYKRLLQYVHYINFEWLPILESYFQSEQAAWHIDHHGPSFWRDNSYFIQPLNFEYWSRHNLPIY